MSILLEFSMTALGKEESVSKYIARSLDIIDKSGVAYQLTPMGTIMEGEWDELMTVVNQCLEKMHSDCDRVSCQIKVDSRKKKSNCLTNKIKSVETKLGRELSK